MRRRERLGEEKRRMCSGHSSRTGALAAEARSCRVAGGYLLALGFRFGGKVGFYSVDQVDRVRSSGILPRGMMGPSVREALSRLCLESGWSYAVFWRATGFGRTMHFIWEDGYCDWKPAASCSKVSSEEQRMVESNENRTGCQKDDGIAYLFDKVMVSKVHVIGDGLIGQAALMGTYQWINRHTFEFDRLGSTSKDYTGIAPGIQTIVVVPVLPFGVILLGSTQMVPENITFIDYVKEIFIKLNFEPGSLQSDTIHSRGKYQIASSPGILYSGSRSTDFCTNMDNMLPDTGNRCIPGIVSPQAPADSLSAEVMLSRPLDTTYPLDKRMLQNTQCMLPHSDMECLWKVLPAADTGSESQSEPSILDFGILSNNLKVLEQELVLTSAIRTVETTSNLPASLISIKSSALKNEVSNDAGIVDKVHSLPRKVIQCSNSGANLSASGISPVLHHRNHLQGDPGILEVSRSNVSLIENISLGTSITEMPQERTDLVEAPYMQFPKSDVLASRSDFLSDILQEYELSYPSPVLRDFKCKGVGYKPNGSCPAENYRNVESTECKLLHALQTGTGTPSSQEFSSSSILCSMLGFDHKAYFSNGSLDDVLEHKNTVYCNNLDKDMAKLPTDSDSCQIFSSANNHASSELFPKDYSDQLLDAVISNINAPIKQDLDTGVSCKPTLTSDDKSHYVGSPCDDLVVLSKQGKNQLIDFTPVPVKIEPACSSYDKSSCSFGKVGEHHHISGISTLVENNSDVKFDSLSDSYSNKVAEASKQNKKRLRPGESPKPRPKDRQMIQDRIRELREIVPNGAKCSIDALLEKTIKHMLFLQSVTKHAGKLKLAGEPKIINEGGGLLLKDNFEGGATWAFEVGAQPMICPIVVEDLNLPRQMLVEMLCEERGFFLEIAEFIKGLGLTILKGIMEARKNKVWARFAVEANREVTRMEIFLSLVRLLEPTAGSMTAQFAAGNINMPNTMFHQTSVPGSVI